MSIKKNIFAPWSKGLGATRRAAVLLLVMMLTATTAWATSISTINVGGTDYTLFTGFTATGGSTGEGVFTYDKAVDGDLSSSWHDRSSGVYIEFNTDDPIVPKGYIFNTYMEGYFYPQAWVLKAKANTTDDWTTLSSYSGKTLSSGQEFQYACNNDGNTAYKYFRFEASNTNKNIWLTEIRLYGNEYIYYTHLTVTPATCTATDIKQECYQRSDGKYFTDETGATELTEADVIDPMIPHSGEHHEATDVNIEYWQCSMCGKYFSDAGCTTEITQTQGVTYLDESGTEQTCLTYTTMTDGSTSLTAGWYVVNDDVTIADRISVSGTVNLILGNGATLTASKGITVGSDATLNIYAQTDDEATMGALVASGANGNQQYNAGIGGVDGTAAGTITINGGKINATGMIGAGIGSGGNSGATVGTITINGGIVTAQDGSGYGAGIGGGGWSGKAGTINLNGGVIHAAGIGSGYSGGDCSITVNISDGVKKIVATPVQGGACIGSGKLASGSVTVNFKSGGNVVTGNDKDAVFYDTGEGAQRQVRTKALNHAVTMSDGLKANITVSTEYAFTGETVTLTLGTAVDATTLSVNDGAVATADAGNRQYTFIMPDGDATVTATLLQTYAVNLPANMEIISATNAADANGKYITGTTVNFKASFPYAASNVYDGTNTLTATDGVYSVTVADADVTVTATVERNSPIDLSGATDDFTVINNDVLTGSTSGTLTIADGAGITLSGATITGSIVCEGSATITLAGTNSTTGKYGKAGIQIGSSGTTLTIRGDGSLTTNGGSQSAGIGLSRIWNYDSNVSSGNIVIEGGTITATGGHWGAGIGTGVIKNTNNDNSTSVQFGNVTIKGGTVTATGGDSGDGIGKGYSYSGPAITFGTVTIYDDIDKVDASSIKNSGSIVYKHEENDVTASTSDYFTIIENGNRRIIVQKVTPTIADVPDQTYTGSAITPEPLVQTGSLNLIQGTDYEYSYTNNTNVGTAKVTVTFKGDYASLGYVEKEFNIVKATPAVTAPTAVADLVYKGSAQALVNAGSTDFGTLLYSLDGQNYSADIPTATDAGTYTIYYKVEGSDNWNAVAAQTIQATILPSTVIVNVTGNGTVTYNDKSAASGETFGVAAEKGTDVTLTLAPESGYAVSIAYGYTNNSRTASGLKLPINGTTARLTVPNDLKDGTYVNLTVTFVSALAGGADEASAVALTGNTVTNFAGGWYKVDSNITFDHTLNLLGDTHLIIDDGKTMTVNTATSEGILSDYTLFVSGEGTLSVATTGDYGKAVCVGNYVQSGATVTASGYIGIRCTDDFIAFNFTNDFTFSGGQLTATGSGGGGIWADNDITLSWTNATDYISANSYSAAGTVKIAEDMSLHNGSEVLSGTISDMNKLNGKTLIGVDVLQDKAVNDIDALTGKQTNITLSGRTLYKDGYWNTLVLPFDVTIASSPLAGDNVVAKVLSTTSELDNGTLTLNFSDAPATIPAGTPFIIKWDKSDDLVNPVFTGVTIDKTTCDVNFTGGSFMGTYAPLEITDANRSKVLLLSGGNKLGYAKTDRTIANGKALGTCRAYFYFSDSQTARNFVMNFGEDDTTSLREKGIVKSEEFATAAEWYTLDGVKLSGKPTKKGLYIVNGKKKFVR